MATKNGEAVYKLVQVTGTTTKSWEDAAKNAVETASKTLRDLRIAEVVEMDLKLEGRKVMAYRTRVLLSFKYESQAPLRQHCEWAGAARHGVARFVLDIAPETVAPNSGGPDHQSDLLVRPETSRLLGRDA